MEFPMAFGDNYDNGDTPSEHEMPVQSDDETSTEISESSDKDDNPPDKDLSHWGDYDEAVWPVMELYGYRNPVISGNQIFNKIVEDFGLINYPNPPKNVGPYVVGLKIMFRKAAEFGEIDFEP